MDDAAKAAHRERIQELLHFINSQPRNIMEFDESLLKKLLEVVKVSEDFLEFPIQVRCDDQRGKVNTQSKSRITDVRCYRIFPDYL